MAENDDKDDKNEADEAKGPSTFDAADKNLFTTSDDDDEGDE